MNAKEIYDKLQEAKSPFKSEVELCAAAISELTAEGWVAYPETCGFDIVLVGHGWTVGVQAKLKANMAVLVQGLNNLRHDLTAPDYVAILTDSTKQNQDDFRAICSAIGIIHIPLARYDPVVGVRINLASKIIQSPLDFRCSGKPLELPEYIPDVPAGASGPVQLTPWKIAALKICAVVHITGTVDRSHFRRYHVDERRWWMMGWLIVEKGVYAKGPKMHELTDQHPVVWPQILHDVEKKLRVDGELK